MIGKGYIPPPIDITETLKSYSTSAQINTILANKWKDIYPIGSVYCASNNENPNTLFGGQWEKLLDSLSDNEIINTYFNTTDLSIASDANGYKWLTLVNHNVNSGSNIYSSVAEALHCTTTSKLSNLYLLQGEHNILKNSSGQYEFKLEYPELGSGCNQWRQTSNPLTTYDTVTGYTAIQTTYTGSNWGGISLQNASINTKSSCLLSGCQNTNNWWFAICSYSNYNSGIPGPQSSQTVVKYNTVLSVRVPSLESNNFFNTGNFNLLTYNNIIYWKRVE